MSKHYDLKELFALVDIDWYPEKEILNRVVNKNLLYIKFPKLNSKEREKFWQELFNPFENFKRKEFIDAKKQV